ncbi:MAG: LexA family protein [Cyanobacteriota bacterium]
MDSPVLAELPLAQPIAYRSAAHPDGIDLHALLIPSPLTTFFMRVRGHRLGGWGVRDGDLLVIDRAVAPQPGHLLVVAHGGRFLLRPLVVEGGRWHLAPLADAEAPIPLDGLDPLASGLFGVAVQAVHQGSGRRLVRSGAVAAGEPWKRRVSGMASSSSATLSRGSVSWP